MVSFRLLVDPSAGLDLERIGELGVEVFLLPYKAFFKKEEESESKEAPVMLRWTDDLSEDDLKDLNKKGYLPSFGRPSLGEWMKIIENIPDDKDILYIAMTQSVTNSISTINTINNLLGRKHKIFSVNSLLLNNRFLIEDLLDSNFDIKEALDFIDLFTRKNRNYENYYIAPTSEFARASNRGVFQDKQSSCIVWCDEKGNFTNYPLSYSGEINTIKQLIDLHEGWKRLDIDTSFDVDREIINFAKNYASSLGIKCRTSSIKPLYGIELGTSSIELDFAKEEFYLYEY